MAPMPVPTPLMIMIVAHSLEQMQVSVTAPALITLLPPIRPSSERLPATVMCQVPIILLSGRIPVPITPPMPTTFFLDTGLVTTCSPECTIPSSEIMPAIPISGGVPMFFLAFKLGIPTGVTPISLLAIGQATPRPVPTSCI